MAMTLCPILPWLFPVIVTLVTAEIVPPVTINTFGSCASADGALEKRLAILEAMITKQQDMLATVINGGKEKEVIRDCADIYERGNHTSGVHIIHPTGLPRPLPVHCDFRDDGRWTVIQRRYDGMLDFQRSWSEYKKGFGHPENSLWLGNDALSAITQQRQYKLRVEITDWEDITRYAEYRYIMVEPEDRNYRLHYANYSGNAGDALAHYHLNQSFSTFDRDNDRSQSEACAAMHGGGWWYRDCDRANLNGRYRAAPDHTMRTRTDAGIEWDAWREMYSFKRTLMKIAPTFLD